MKPVCSAAFAAMIAAVTATARDAAWSAEKKYGPDVSDSEIKVGQTIAYSGPASSFGTTGHTTSAYYRMVNDRGGINGRKINFIRADDGARWVGFGGIVNG
jgi:branched-chain amino acid transport system substrate-binding protein